jgi:hypothetical protein
MRRILLCILMLASTACGHAQAAPAAASDLDRALTGRWVGTIEYRDYSEPATSTKRTKLPTWLTIEPEASGLRCRYTYDDGPTKVVADEETIRFDPAAATYTATSTEGKTVASYSVAGFAALRDGHGTLVMTGTGSENNAPAQVRTTLHIGRNILEIVEETGAPGQPLVFRHAYTFVRAEPPPPGGV